MDEDNWTSRTDVIVVVDTSRRRLTWVPRDLWAPGIADRINLAFAHGQLLPQLAALGFPCSGLLGLRRSATEAALANIDIDVTVSETMEFWYPLTPMQRIEDGRKRIVFSPPSERLSGERLHQWIGARYGVAGGGSDLNRLRRQITLLRALIAQRADFADVLRNPDRIHIEGDPLPLLASVTSDWDMRVFDRVRSATIDGKDVLLKVSLPRWAISRARRFVSRQLARLRSG